MTALYLKAIHIIFIVTWFAGLFYIPRLFINIIEAHEKPEPEKTILTKQLKIMASRLWFAITWPSAIITLLMGTSLIINNPSWLQFGFMHIKLTLVVVLYAYHFSLHIIFKQLQRDVVKYRSQQMRIWNEVATLLLISIVFLIVLKNALSMAWGISGLLVITAAIMIGIKLYKKHRSK
ncbi:MAG TPA: CopD family protein [Ohtaekwangia sp.]|nr:CopD family protein [Ohtaekwangia sp.]